MKIKVLKRLPDYYHAQCLECGRNKKEGPYIKIEWEDFWESQHLLCFPCLTTLRSKVDALSILVQTGIDTKENK